ncbi:peptidoglycan-binding protein [Streptomyces sp. SID8352]|uniref:peptidoglycan-binding protein n=1 Tax=Streptomyces sp. SID8352 TaxID=2690338 RepID=UPI00137195D1|nr:peptidoglycan-binding protein [Streptomyces sp. SID8352]MYU22169.1 hypothetical protein [Streptomyces sp. SID8352]
MENPAFGKPVSGVPVFEEFEPAGDCACRGCRALPGAPAARVPARVPGRPAARPALVVAAATTAGAILGAVPAAAVPAAGAPVPPGVPAPGEGATRQGPQGPLFGTAGLPVVQSTSAALPATTRAEIIVRAEKWVTAKVPYSTTAHWSDGYRQDCSGYVSMAWNLPANEWTGSLATFADRISRDELQPGDILLFHNAADPQNGSHVVIFGGWTDGARTHYTGYEQTPPSTRRQTTPYAYWSNSAQYVPYRYKGVEPATTGGAPSRAAYPGASAFGPGAVDAHVTEPGRMLAARGGSGYHTSGPGPGRTAADRAATGAFQRAQDRRGADADGLPGPAARRLPVTGGGRDATAPAAPPGYPGRDLFRPGAVGDHITRLGRRLVEKGYGRHYTIGPGPRWSEADRRNVEAFQRAQGWRGGAADGHPGPETWRRLFS